MNRRIISRNTSRTNVQQPPSSTLQPLNMFLRNQIRNPTNMVQDSDSSDEDQSIDSISTYYFLYGYNSSISSQPDDPLRPNLDIRRGQIFPDVFRRFEPPSRPQRPRPIPIPRPPGQRPNVEHDMIFRLLHDVLTHPPDRNAHIESTDSVTIRTATSNRNQNRSHGRRWF